MKLKRSLLWAATNLLFAAIGFMAGIYMLPILIAPAPASPAQLEAAKTEALYQGQFRRDLKGSDWLHWGEGTLAIGRRSVAFQGRLAPGPDYKLYFSPEFIDNATDFLRLKSSLVRVGDVRSFGDFVLPLPPEFDPSRYEAVVIWCEAFGQFITAARYR